jgi:hypothetical protein
VKSSSRDTLDWVALAVTLLGVAVSLVAVVVHHLPRTICLFVAGLAFFAAAAIAVYHGHRLVSEIHERLRPTLNRLPWLRHSRGEFDYQLHQADERLLAEAVRVGKAKIGDGHPSVETLNKRLGKNREVILLYGRRYHANERFELCGYALLYPLSDKAGKAIEKGRIRSGAEIEPGHLRADFAAARYLYVGMVLATDREAKPHVKAMLRLELMRRLEGSPVVRVFGKPASRGGLKMLGEYGFKPIRARDGIWSVERIELMGNLRARSGQVQGAE